METCFKILQLKFDQKLINRCIGLTMKISASTRLRRLHKNDGGGCGVYGARPS